MMIISLDTHNSATVTHSQLGTIYHSHTQSLLLLLFHVYTIRVFLFNSTKRDDVLAITFYNSTNIKVNN